MMYSLSERVFENYFASKFFAALCEAFSICNLTRKRSHVVRFYGMLKIPTVQKRNSVTFLTKFFLLRYLVSLLVSARDL